MSTRRYDANPDKSMVNIIFGCSPIGRGDGEFGRDDGVSEALAALQQFGINKLDTALRYGEGKSEEVLGRLRAGHKDNKGQSFVIDTKWMNMTDHPVSEHDIIESVRGSLARLNVSQVNTLYIHFPDKHTPLSTILSAYNALYNAKAYQKFGLSNYSPAQVKEVYDHCVQHGYVLPTVYQGQYNAVFRSSESDLFPMLRTLNIEFNAFSPIGGGFLTKTRADIEGETGRFVKGSIGQWYENYARPEMLEALDSWVHIADGEGISRAELAYRWVTWHSELDARRGDGILVGASSVKQLRETLQSIENGPLSSKAVGQIQFIWEKILSARN